MIQIQDVSFSYTGDSADVSLCRINLTVQRGEVVLLCGPSGCGKTTLTRLINGLVPHYYEGALLGRVLVEVREVSSLPLYDTAKWVGSVFQNPRSQFFNVETTGELAFCCENLGLPKQEILQRMERTVRELNMEALMNRNMFKLSGGEKQRVACASVSVADPPVIVLDEPSSNLDMAAIEDLRLQIERWKLQGKTIIIAEHRLHYLRELMDRVIYMEDGQILREYTPEELRRMSLTELDALGLRPVSLEALFDYNDQEKILAGGAPIRLERFQFGYRNFPDCLHLSSANFPQQAIVALIGRNGAGKTTLARCLCGLEKCCKGTLHAEGKGYQGKGLLKNCFMVMQDVNHQLFTESVLDEILLSMPEKDEQQAEKVLADLNLIELKDRHPMSLSGGQKQRVAIACAVVSGRKFLILDEPTSGLDLRHMKKTAAILKDLQRQGHTLLVVTHDPEFILRCCSHVLQIEDGKHAASYPLDEAGRRRLVGFFLNGEHRERRTDCCESAL
ncbi:MAG: ABC transporter ATP-binding protein [Christensenellales bacterium]